MIRVATWNLQWASTGSARWAPIQRRLADVDADVAVLTEVTSSIIEQWPHHLDGGTAEGICTGHRRKVAIVSKHPLRLVDAVGSDRLPPANFLAVDVLTPLGEIRVVGVVIRWNMIRDYVAALPEALAPNLTDRTILAGDYNVRLPADDFTLNSNRTAGRELAGVLDDARLELVTGGEHPQLERPLIDHIAVGRGLVADTPMIWPRRDLSYENGEKDITDHAGAAVDLRFARDD